MVSCFPGFGRSHLLTLLTSISLAVVWCVTSSRLLYFFPRSTVELGYNGRPKFAVRFRYSQDSVRGRSNDLWLCNIFSVKSLSWPWGWRSGFNITLGSLRRTSTLCDWSTRAAFHRDAVERVSAIFTKKTACLSNLSATARFPLYCTWFRSVIAEFDCKWL